MKKAILLLSLLSPLQYLFSTSTVVLYWKLPFLNVEFMGNYGSGFESLAAPVAQDLAKAIITSNVVSKYLERLNARGLYKGDPPIKLLISYMRSDMVFLEDDTILISLPFLPKNTNTEALNIVDQALGLDEKYHKITKISYGWVYTLQIVAYNSKPLLKKYWLIHFKNSLPEENMGCCFLDMSYGIDIENASICWWYARENGFFHLRYGLYVNWIDAYKGLLELKKLTNFKAEILRRRPNSFFIKNFLQNKILESK